MIVDQHGQPIRRRVEYPPRDLGGTVLEKGGTAGYVPESERLEFDVQDWGATVLEKGSGAGWFEPLQLTSMDIPKGGGPEFSWWQWALLAVIVIAPIATSFAAIALGW